jgi:glyoxylase I family protein
VFSAYRIELLAEIAWERNSSGEGNADLLEELQMIPDEAVRHEPVILGCHGIRYQIRDVKRAVEFYTTHLGFKLEHQQLPAFATVSLGDLKLLLSGPGASGSRTLPDGRRQDPGGWNRIVLRVSNVERAIEALTKAGVQFRNQLESGPGGRQIQLEDPDGNPVELFEPAARR